MCQYLSRVESRVGDDNSTDILTYFQYDLRNTQVQSFPVNSYNSRTLSVLYITVQYITPSKGIIFHDYTEYVTTTLAIHTSASCE